MSRAACSGEASLLGPLARLRDRLAGVGAVRRDYTTTFLTSLVVTGAYLVAFRIVAYDFGPTALGEYALSRRAIALLAPLAALGVDLAITRLVAYDRGSGQRKVYLSAGLLLVVVDVVAITAVILTLQSSVGDLMFGSRTYSDLVRPLPLVVLGVGLHGLAYGELRGRQRVQSANGLMLVNYAVVPLLALWLGGNAIPAVLFAMGAGMVLVSGAFISFMEHSRAYLFQRLWELLKYGAPRIPGTLLQLAMFSAPGVVVAHVSDIRTAGTVAFGVAALGLVGSALSPIGLVLLPIAAEMLGRGSHTEFRAQVVQITKIMLPLLVGGIVVFEIAAEPLVRFYLGSAYLDTVGLLRLLVLAALPWGLYVILRSAMDAHDVFATNSLNTVIAFAAFFVLTLILARYVSPTFAVVDAFVAGLYVLGGLTVFSASRVLQK